MKSATSILNAFCFIFLVGNAAEVQQELCRDKSDCIETTYSVCSSAGVCEHKSVYPFETSELIGIVTLPILLGLANIAGIGGGGVVIPLAMGCWGFGVSEAVAISNSTVFAGAVLRFIGFSTKEKHPHAPRTVIDYNLASLMMPAVFLGSFTGFFLVPMIPEASITIILTLLLAYLTYNTYRKTVVLCAKESREVQNYRELDDLSAGSVSSPIANYSLSSPGAISTITATKPSPTRDINTRISKAMMSLAAPPPPQYIRLAGEESIVLNESTEEDLDTVRKLEERERTDRGQWRHHARTAALILISFIVQSIRGANSLSGIQTCSTADSVILGSFFTLTGFIIIYEARRIQNEQDLKLSHGQKLFEGELRLTGGRLVKLLLGSVAGGLVGAMGLGGGVVFNPVLLGLGVPPTVVAATSMYLIMYSQASNTAIYAIRGDLPMDYALWIGFCSCLGILLCLLVMQRVVAHTKRQSPIVMVLTIIMAFSALMVPAISIPKLIAKQESGYNIWAFTAPCGH